MTKRDRETLRRLMDQYGERELIDEMAVALQVRAADRKQAGDVIAQRWNERAALALPYFTRYGLSLIDGRKESQPEIDNILTIS